MNPSIATIALLALLARPAAAQEPAPAAPTGAEVEPPEQTSPSDPAAASTQHKLDSLAKELSRVANAYGPDAVALQVGLLVQAMAAGAVDVTEVSVRGPSPAAGDSYLRIEVRSGLIFDARTSTPSARAQTIWRDLVAPAIGALEKFQTEPANLELVVDYGLQNFGEILGSKPDPTIAYEHRQLRFEVPEVVMADNVGAAEPPPDTLGRCRVFDADRLLDLQR